MELRCYIFFYFFLLLLFNWYFLMGYLGFGGLDCLLLYCCGAFLVFNLSFRYSQSPSSSLSIGFFLGPLFYNILTLFLRSSRICLLISYLFSYFYLLAFNLLYFSLSIAWTFCSWYFFYFSISPYNSSIFLSRSFFTFNSWSFEF